MSDTPNQRTDEPGEDLGTTPPAPQGRTDEEQDDRSDSARESADLQSPVTEEEVDRRQLGDEVE